MTLKNVVCVSANLINWNKLHRIQRNSRVCPGLCSFPAISSQIKAFCSVFLYSSQEGFHRDGFSCTRDIKSEVSFVFKLGRLSFAFGGILKNGSYTLANHTLQLWTQVKFCTPEITRALLQHATRSSRLLWTRRNSPWKTNVLFKFIYIIDLKI